jgi:glycosyltransferase involved in cell wall biosynthesis
MKPKISVILPCYQAEQYIQVCLDSLCQQTFAEYEVICVEDGSKDNTLALLQAYQTKQPHLIKVVAHEKNQGSGAAKNTGMAHAQGEYLTFVDSDDFIPPDALANLFAAAQKFQADVVIGGMIRFRGRRVLPHNYSHMMPHAGLVKSCREEVPFALTTVAPWAKLYKTSFYREQVGNFPEIRFAEDVQSGFKTWWRAARIAQITEIVYYYRFCSSSIMNGTAYQIRIDSMLANYHAMYSLIKADSPKDAKAIFLHYMVGLDLRYGHALYLFFEQQPEFELELLFEIFVLPKMTYKFDKGLKRQLKKAQCQMARLLYKIKIRRLKKQYYQQSMPFEAVM